MGAKFYNKEDLHGKVVTLTREGKKRKGVVLAKDLKKLSENLVFQWKSDDGKSCISPIGDDELKMLQNGEVKDDGESKE